MYLAAVEYAAFANGNAFDKTWASSIITRLRTPALYGGMTIDEVNETSGGMMSVGLYINNGAGSSSSAIRTPNSNELPRTGAATGHVVTVAPNVSVQRQNRHVIGTREYESGTAQGGSYFNTIQDAQQVLNAYRSGLYQLVGTNKQGQPIIKVSGVTGYNNNPRAGYVNQPTNTFLIMGTSSVSVVPTLPAIGR